MYPERSRLTSQNVAVGSSSNMADANPYCLAPEMTRFGTQGRRRSARRRSATEHHDAMNGRSVAPAVASDSVANVQIPIAHRYC
jgi:hypothetical protein